MENKIKKLTAFKKNDIIPKKIKKTYIIKKVKDSKPPFYLHISKGSFILYFD